MKKLKTFFAWLWHKFCGFWPWYRNLYRGKAWYTKTAIGLVSCIIAFILYLGAVDINFLWLFGKSPGYFSGIMNPQTSEASEIYSADGKLIGKYFNENRTPVTYEEVNPDFFKALVDTEDERFYKHLGIDPIGLFGAAKDALLHHDARGASTITQQLAKNMFRVRSQSLFSASSSSRARNGSSQLNSKPYIAKRKSSPCMRILWISVPIHTVSRLLPRPISIPLRQK